jgi:hypothetical protein
MNIIEDNKLLLKINEEIQILMEKSDNGDIERERERENDLLVYGYNMIN